MYLILAIFSSYFKTEVIKNAPRRSSIRYYNNNNNNNNNNNKKTQKNKLKN